jgi:tRNA-splicing ligase RtcB
MNPKELAGLGIPKRAQKLAIAAIKAERERGLSKAQIRGRLARLVESPAAYIDDPTVGALAKAFVEDAAQAGSGNGGYRERREPAPFRQWGEDLDAKSIEQMTNACRLPIAVRGALMADAHVGYGLPIGGVLATRGAVIPYAVGVDIACRMKISVLDLTPSALSTDEDRLKKAIREETRFGVGSQFKTPRRHDVMDRDWTVSPVTQKVKDKAWHQLGTSGSGNHFVELGVFTLDEPHLGLAAGDYLALLSHSGSRGAGASVASHYSKLAMKRHRDLPQELRHLAWLDLDSEEGQEYWAAMQLMGRYAEANHACIHRHLVRNLGARVVLDVENHHNFAWKEEHDGEEVVVHRKGATPASEGMLGIIPGSMVHPAYVVEGLGNEAALQSAAHGAGRVMSRKQAKRTFHWEDARRVLDKYGVTLISAGRDLVRKLARFQPKLVKMAPAGERPED